MALETSLRSWCLVASLSLLSCVDDSLGSGNVGTLDGGAEKDGAIDHTGGDVPDGQSAAGDATAGSSDAGDAWGVGDAAGIDRGDAGPEAGDASGPEDGAVDAGTRDAVTGVDAAMGDGARGAARDSGGDGAGGVGACTGCTFTNIAMDGTKLVYDASRGLLYVTSSAQAVVNPNTLTVVDLASATVTANIPIGMDPNPLALSDDDSTLWVGLTGDGAIRKVTLGSGAPTVGALQPVPPEASGGVSSTASHLTDMAVFPGSPTTVAASLTSDLGGTWVSVFDDGVARPVNGSSSLYKVSRVVVGPPGYVFGYDNISSAFTLSVFNVGTIGATFLSGTPGLITGFLGFLLNDNNRLFSFYGEVVDVSTPTQPVRAGLFPYWGDIAVRDASHVFMLSTLSLPYTLRLLDSTTFTQVAAVALPAEVLAATPNYPNLAYIGGDELVFFVNDVNNSHAICIAHVPPLASTP